MARVGAPGSRIAATVWAPRRFSPFYEAQSRMLIDWGGVSSRVIDQAYPPGGEETLLGWARGAGLTGATVEKVEREVTLPPLGVYVTEHLRVVPWAAPFLALDPATQSKAVGGMLAELAAYEQETVVLPFTSLLLVAGRPS
jgi:hypothetical protein